MSPQLPIAREHRQHGGSARPYRAKNWATLATTTRVARWSMQPKFQLLRELYELKARTALASLLKSLLSSFQRAMRRKHGFFCGNDIGNDSEFSHISLTDEREHSKAVLKASNHSHDVPPAPLPSGARGTRWGERSLGQEKGDRSRPWDSPSLSLDNIPISTLIFADFVARKR